MSSFSFSTVIHSQDREYLVKTVNFDSIRRIVINLQDHDRVLNSREVHYEDNLSDEALMALVKRSHEERVEGLQELLRISKKLEQKVEVDSNHKLGMVFLHHGMGREAAAEFERALNFDSANAPILNHLGLAYLLEDRMAEADKTFQQAIVLKPDYPDLHNNAGLALLKKNLPSEAVREFGIALGLNPNYAEAHFNWGLAKVLQAALEKKVSDSDRKEMQQHLTRAVDLNQQYKNEFYEVAQEHLAKDQWEEARHALLEAKIAVGPQAGGEIFHEFYLRLKYGDEGIDRQATERYISKLESLLEKKPNFVDVRNDLGVAYLIQCRFLFNKAVNEFKRALTINPNYGKAQKNLKLAENEGKGFLILLRAILYF